MRNIFETIKRKDIGSIGIGAMIVFIAMVLVAGIAASVLIQTSTKLETQAMKSGQETIAEVSTGIAVTDVEGYCSAVTANISKLTITVRPRAGSAPIDLKQAYLEISDTDYKIVLKYTAGGSDFNDSSSGVDNIFGASCFPSAANRFGILVLEDYDSSCTSSNPIINRGDKVMLCVDTSQCFSSGSGILERTDIWGMIAPEEGSPGVLAFTTPASYTNNVMDLQ